MPVEARSVDPARPRHRQVGDRGDATLQQLGDRDLGGGAGVLGREAIDREVFVERALAQLVGTVFLREALVGGLGKGM
jgi:hypothetical protein